MNEIFELPETILIEEWLKSTWHVSPLSNYLPDFKSEYQVLMDFLNDLPPDTSFEERLRQRQEGIDLLKNKFRKKRAKEYYGKSITLSVPHSCTSSAGRRRNCGWKYIHAPVGGYTKNEWVRVEGNYKEIKVNSTWAAIRITKAGRGTNKGTLFATFKYQSSYIQQEVEADLNELYLQVVSPNTFEDELSIIQNIYEYEEDKASRKS